MGVCDNCGNNYETTFSVVMNSKTYEFDCFECAIHLLAPKCKHCGTQIIGHGVEDESSLYCCAACARAEGSTTLNDGRASNIYTSP